MLLGKYRVERELGKGGMGVVLAVRHLELDEVFALKVLLPESIERRDSVDRLIREAQVTARIRSEHIVKVFDVGRLDPDRPYMLMEHLLGNDLKQVLRTRGPLPVHEVIDYVLQACGALAEAHAQGVVHRDIKPSNLFLAERPNGTLQIKVIDFGISKAFTTGEADRTGSGVVQGSPLYMSPEQLMGSRDVGMSTDIWALGCVLYELVTGKAPFDAETLTAVVGHVLTHEPPPPSRLRAEVPQWFDAVVMRCLRKAPEDRCPTVDELAIALREADSAPEMVVARDSAPATGPRGAPSAPSELAAAPSAAAETRRNEPPDRAFIAYPADAERQASARPIAPPSRALPAGAVTPARRRALPLQSTAFIGRDAQIAEVIALLRREDRRLITLTGMGGTGKTRLSLEIARACLRDFPDGAVQVSLGSVEDAALVPASIAHALDVAEMAGIPLVDVLKNSIGTSRLLLVLDTFEHIVDAAPVVAALLASCAGLKVMVTSREALKISGEREYIVPPLDVPPAAPETSVAIVASSEAVQLFVDRVRAVQPSFELTAESSSSVATICRCLEGIPLAIELAASRMKMLTLPALLKRLSDRLGFLKGTERDRAQRHQTLRAAIDWSFNLLDEPQKTLLCRTSVFTGGFSIESAEEVCGAGDDRSLDVLEGLSSLVDKSLLTRSEVDGEPRLGALDTIREYALERLRATPDEALMRERHAEHFAALVEEMSPGVMGRAFRRCAGRLSTEADNIRAALAWALEQPSHTITARMLRELQWFWFLHGRFDEARAWVTRALEQTRAQSHTPERGMVLEAATWLCLFLGDLPSWIAHSTEGVALWKDLGREAEGARTRILFGLGTAASGSFPEGVRLVQEAGDTCRAHEDVFGAALALNVLGEIARAAGDYDTALVRYEEATALLQELGNIMASSLAAINLAFCYLHKGDWAQAARIMVQPLELSLELNNHYNFAFYLAIMAGVAIVRGDHAEGLRLLGACGGVLQSLGAAVQPVDQIDLDRYTAAAKAALGDDAAAEALQEGAAWTRADAIAATLPLRS